MLEALGLSPEESRAYEVMATRGALTLGELCACWGELAPDRPGAEVLLAQLQRRGLVVEVIADPPRYAAARADVSLGRLIVEQAQALVDVRAFVERLALSQRENEEPVAVTQLLEVVSGREAIYHRSLAMFREAREELRSIDKPPYVTPALGGDPEELEFLASGGRVRALYDASAIDSAESIGSLEPFLAAGEEARVAVGAPTKLFIADNRLALLPMRLASSDYRALVVHPCGLLDALIALFESCWQAAVPIASAVLGAPAGSATRRLDGLSPAEQRIVSLLAAGLADKTIAHQLGVSLRTLQRRLTELFDRVGARTRFDFALRAAERGWVPLREPGPAVDVSAGLAPGRARR